MKYYDNIKINIKAIFFVATIILAVFFVSCKDDHVCSSNVEVDTLYIKSKDTFDMKLYTTFPFLKVGHSWTYRQEAYNNIMDTVTITISHRSNSDPDFPNYLVCYEKYSYPADSLGVKFLATDSSVIPLPIISDISYVPNYIPNFALMKKNYSFGKNWTEGTGQRVVVAISKTVTTKAGTFNNCIEIRERDLAEPNTEYNMWYWYVRNDIGIIKVERFLFNNGVGSSTHKLELIGKNF